MLESVNERLISAKGKLQNLRKLERLLAECRKELMQEQQKEQQLKETLRQSEKHLRQMQGLSLAHLFHSVMGNQVVEEQKVMQEVLVARLHCEACTTAIAHIGQECNELSSRIDALGKAEVEYQSLLKEKEDLLVTHSLSFRTKMAEITDSEASIASEIKETRDAIFAAEPALQALFACSESLSKAEDWGTWDMLGGGVLVTAVKRDHMEDAKDHMLQAQQYLRSFTRELQDLNQSVVLNMETNGFLHFSDYFFDGLFVDWMVQQEIRETSRQVSEHIQSVQTIKQELDVRMGTLETQQQQLASSRVKWIEEAGE